MVGTLDFNRNYLSVLVDYEIYLGLTSFFIIIRPESVYNKLIGMIWGGKNMNRVIRITGTGNIKLKPDMTRVTMTISDIDKQNEMGFKSKHFLLLSDAI